MPSSVLLSLKKCPQILDSYRQCVERRPQDHDVRYFSCSANVLLLHIQSRNMAARASFPSSTGIGLGQRR